MKDIDEFIEFEVIRGNFKNKVHLHECGHTPDRYNKFSHYITLKRFRERFYKAFDNKLCNYCAPLFKEKRIEGLHNISSEDLVMLIFEGDPRSRKIALKERKRRSESSR